jgi:hypothetical protein
MVWPAALRRITHSLSCCAAAAGCLVPSLARAEAAAPRAASGGTQKDECLQAHESAQLLRLDTKLVEAKRALAVCSREGCPNAVRADCTEWLSQVNASTPSVVLAATSERGDENRARVSLDGAELTQELDGKAIELDPGPHTFRFELAPYPPVEQRLVLREGEHERSVAVRFANEEPPPKPPMPSAPPVGAMSRPAERPVPWITYALGGATLAAIGSATTFGLIALNRRSDKLASCAPLCSERDKRDVERPALAADVSVIIALVAGGATIYTYWTRPQLGLSRWLAATPQLSCSIGARASYLHYRRNF